MALFLDKPKSRWLFPFFILLIIVLAPLALMLSLLRLPFAKNRTATLNEIIADDWLPRKKYVYINYDESFPLAELVSRQLIPKYRSYIIFDRWSDADSEWVSGEPDTYHRVLTVQQDIAGDFDGDAHLLVAVLSPEEPYLTTASKNILYFSLGKDGRISLNGKGLKINAAKAQIIKKIDSGIEKWEANDERMAYVLASYYKDGFRSEEIVRDLDDALANLEYGDVAEGEYQIWEYPSGKIFQVTSDREVDDNSFYSPPSTSKGTVWEPKLTEISSDKAKVKQAYDELLRK